jgi:CDP-diacylglycerol--serine O-phosphatidyltransferase
MKTYKTMFGQDYAQRSRYLLPSLFTTGVLCAGFYACVQAVAGRYDSAAVAILLALILDGLDGRVARLMHTQTAFGAEYDSLADMVAFGAAPALLAFEWALGDLGLLGWTAALVYCTGAGLRLARFNTKLAVADKRWFQGLPSPAAAALVVGFIWLADDYGFDPAEIRWYGWFVLVFAGVSMVTNLKFYSFKSINLRKTVPFFVVLAIALGIVLVSYDPPVVLFGAFVLYGVSGYAWSAWDHWRRRGAAGP